MYLYVTPEKVNIRIFWKICTTSNNKMAPQIERVVENCVFGEGPHWDAETKSLYFVDVFDKSICRYIPATHKITKAKIGSSVSLIIPIRGQKNKFLLGKEEELVIISWDGESDKISVVKNIDIKSDPGTIFNDGKCDSTGRLWIGTTARFDENGTIEKEKGSIYKMENGRITVVTDKISVSNGLDFNTALKKMYYIDSLKGTVDQFDIDEPQGTISNRQSIFTLSKHDIPGIPDGMTIDTDGNLWVAICNGGRIIKIDPRKPETLLYTVSLPAKQTTSVAFGGESLNEIYVTTGRSDFGTEEKLLPPENGALYKITGLGVHGFPGRSLIL